MAESILSHIDLQRHKTPSIVAYEDDDKYQEDGFGVNSTSNLMPPELKSRRSWRRQTTLNSYIKNDELMKSKKLQLPYRKGVCCAKFAYHWRSIIVTNPRLFSLYLLYSSIWPRLLVLLDMYTDFIVAKDLYQHTSNQGQIENLNTRESAILFMLTCVFILFPFVMVWTASLRFIHRYLTKNYQKKKHNKCTKIAFNAFLICYLFPPIGCLLMSLLEMYWVFYDIFRGLFYFFMGRILIINTDPQIKAIKQFRKVIEFFGESFPQLILQLYIFVFSGSDYVNIRSLTLSICISAFSFGYNLWKLWRESRIHGMTIAEYALSLLQLSEIPIIKLVPRLPAVRNGRTSRCNFAYYRIDKESLGPIIDALSDEKCRLKQIKLSLDSLSHLDDESLTMLGGILKRKDLKIIISQIAHPKRILQLFQTLDTGKKRYLEFKEFKKLICFAFRDEQIQEKVFQNLAVRRLKKRDRVYFYDFYQSISGYRSRLAQYDFSIIEYPIHWIIKYVTKLYNNVNCDTDDKESINGDLLVGFDVDRYGLNATNSTSNVANWKIVLNKLLNLYYFAIGCGYDTQFDETNGYIHNNIFFTIIDALTSLSSNDDDSARNVQISLNNDKQTGPQQTENQKVAEQSLGVVDLVQALIWKIFWHLLRKTNASQTIDEFNNIDQHIFMYCKQRKQWRIFTILFNYFLLHNGEDSESLNDYIKFEELTNDYLTILRHALKDNLEKVAKYILGKYKLQTILYSKKDDVHNISDQVTRQMIFSLFTDVFMSRNPSVTMVKLLLELLDIDDTKLLTDTMINDMNLLNLAIKCRISTTSAEQTTVSKTISTILSYCIMERLEIHSDSLNAMKMNEIDKYGQGMLEIIQLLISLNNDLCIDQDSQNHSAMSVALAYKDTKALMAMLENIDQDNIRRIITHKHKTFDDLNIFQCSTQQKLYEISNYLIVNYLEMFDKADFICLTTLDQHPFYNIFKDYFCYLKDNSLENSKQCLENLFEIIGYIASHEDVMKYMVQSMNDSVFSKTKNFVKCILMAAQEKRENETYVINQSDIKLLVKQFDDHGPKVTESKERFLYNTLMQREFIAL